MHRYQQLASQLKQQIEANTWRSGEKIPSLRATSRSFSVSSATVLQAYQILESEGWIKARPQSGYYVTSRLGIETPQREEASIRPEYHDELYAFLKSNTQAETALGSAFPSPNLFPIADLNRHLAAAGRKLPAEAIIHNMPPGNEALRRLIAQRYITEGINVSHQDIVLTSGAMEALNLSLEAVCEPGDTVIIESPAFYGALQAIERLKLKAIEVVVDPETGLCIDSLATALAENDVKACWLMANFHNPTGVSLCDEKKRKVIELADQHDVYIVEDDVYSELYFGDDKPSPIKLWDRNDNVLLCGSFSKSLCPGYRIGWVVNRALNEKLQKQQMISTLAGSAPIQQGVAHYLQYESYDNHLRKLRKQLSHRLAAFITSIQQEFPADTVIHEPKGGYFVWLQFSQHIDTHKIYQQLCELGISIGYGQLFSSKQQYQNCMRLNISFEQSETLSQAIRQLGTLLMEQSNN